jgi:hypothetical protein
VIKKRGNSWWVVVYTGRDPLTGKKRQKTGTAKTRAEARQLEARLIREAGTGQHRAAGNKMVAELLDAWSEWRPRKGEITERTMLGYRSVIEHKIIPALGELRLSRVDTATIDRFLAQLSERGTRCKHCQHVVRIGQAPLRAGDRYRPRPGLREREHPTDCVRGLPMSPSAVRDVHAVLSGAFKQAQSPLCHPGRRARPGRGPRAADWLVGDQRPRADRRPLHRGAGPSWPRRWSCGAGPSRPAQAGRAALATPWPAPVAVAAVSEWPARCWSWPPSCAPPALNPSSPKTTGLVDAYQAEAAVCCQAALRISTPGRS